MVKEENKWVKRRVKRSGENALKRRMVEKGIREE